MKVFLKTALLIATMLYSISNVFANSSIPTDEKTMHFLNDMFDTNKRFRDGHDASYFEAFKDSQSPSTTHLGCADSRVHMLSLNQDPKNSIFSIRNIGNQMITSEGSVDYGVQVLETPFLIIIGHSGCGAIHAALAGIETKIPGIDRELKTIKLSETDLNKAIIENVNTQLAFATEKYKDRVDSGKLIILGMIYDFRNDFGQGKGTLILVNANGVTNPSMIKKAYGENIKNLQHLN